MKDIMRYTDPCTACPHERGAHVAPGGCTADCPCQFFQGETLVSLESLERKDLPTRFPLPEGAEPLWSMEDIVAVYQPLPTTRTMRIEDLPNGQKTVVIEWDDGSKATFRRVDRYAEVCQVCGLEQLESSLFLGTCRRCIENPLWLDDDDDWPDDQWDEHDADRT